MTVPILIVKLRALLLLLLLPLLLLILLITDNNKKTKRKRLTRGAIMFTFYTVLFATHNAPCYYTTSLAFFLFSCGGSLSFHPAVSGWFPLTTNLLPTCEVITRCTVLLVMVVGDGVIFNVFFLYTILSLHFRFFTLPH